MVKSVMEVVTLQQKPRTRDTQIVIVISNSRFTLHGSGIEKWVVLYRYRILVILTTL
jgi:hypothetical protein